MNKSLFVMFLAACAPAPDALQVFDATWDDFDARYGPFAQRSVDWDDVREHWRAQLDADADDAALWDVLTGMLAELDDGHVQLYAPDRPHWFSSRVYRERIGDERWDLERVRTRYLDGGGEVGPHDAWLLGTTRGATYVHLPFIGSNVEVLADARARAERGGVGLIVDLRHDHGGDYTFMLDALADWTDEDVPVFRSRTRSGPERGTFGPWVDWAIAGEGEPLDVPVVVLVDRYTLSAGERATLMLRALPGVTLVGEPTNGSLATMIGRELPNGWFVTLPVQEVEDPDGAVHEGVGVPPDVTVLDDLGTPDIDEVMEAALGLLGGA